MNLAEVTNVSLETFRQRSAGKKIVLLYPWTTYRTLFVSHYLSEYDKQFLYYRLTEEQKSLAGWLEGMVAEFGEVLGKFGANLQKVLPEGKPAELAAALAADLKALKVQPLAVFLDEFDRIPLDSDLQEFVRELAATLPDNSQVIFNSRLFTYQPWYDLIVDGVAAVLGTERRKDDVVYRPEEISKPRLEVYSLGRGYAIVNGQAITNWDGALPRNLFFFFMDHALVTRDEIFATFWPNLAVKEATNVFHVTKRKISERIGMKIDEPGSYELTKYSTGFYTPSDKIIRHYDVGDFQDAVERAMLTSDEREQETLLRQAIELYKAPYLQKGKMEWMLQRRDNLRQLYTQALIDMGRLFKVRQESPTAIGFFIRALKESPEREDIHREIMSLYRGMGRLEDARQQYQNLTQILQDSYGINPSRETRELYDLIASES